jgi:hypothetical protein
VKGHIPISSEMRALMQRKKQVFGVKSTSCSKRPSLNVSAEKIWKHRKNSIADTVKLNPVYYSSKSNVVGNREGDGDEICVLL